MCQNKAKKPLFRSICSHVFRCLISIPEHMQSLFSERPRSTTFPEYMRSVSVSNLLTCNLFRRICGHFLRSHGSATFFRSMCSHFSVTIQFRPSCNQTKNPDFSIGIFLYFNNLYQHQRLQDIRLLVSQNCHQAHHLQPCGHNCATKTSSDEFQ